MYILILSFSFFALSIIFISVYMLIVQFKEKIIKKNLKEGEMVNEQVTLLQSQGISDQEKQGILDKWYLSKS